MVLRPTEVGEPLLQAVDPFEDRLSNFLHVHFFKSSPLPGMVSQQEKIMKVLSICILLLNAKMMVFIS